MPRQVDSDSRRFAVLVVDDEGDSLLEIRDMLALDPRLVVAGAYTDPQEVLAALDRWPRLDFAFIDIKMPAISGLELGEILIVDPDHPDDIGDGGPATAAEIGGSGWSSGVYGLHVDADGNIYMADYGGSRIREVAAVSGTQWGIDMVAGNIYTVAGTGTPGYSGDGSHANLAQVAWPTGVTTGKHGELYVADFFNDRVRVLREAAAVALDAATRLAARFPTGTVGSGYDSGAITQFVDAHDGLSPYTWSAAGLPSGLAMNSSGTVTGTSRVAFSGNVTVTVSDSSTPRTSVSVTVPLTVRPAAPGIGVLPAPVDGVYNGAQDVTVTMEGQTPGGQSIEIWYTTDGSDPVEGGEPVGGNDPGASAIEYAASFALPLIPDSVTTLKARVRESGQWSDSTSTVLTCLPAFAPAIDPAPTAAPGTVVGTTRITGTDVAAGHSLAVQVPYSPAGTPRVGSDAPAGDGVTNPYTPGDDLAAASEDYVGIFELDGSGKVFAFSPIRLGSDDVRSVMPDAPALSSAPTAAEGTALGTTRITVTGVAGGHSLAVRVTPAPMSTPRVGDAPPSGVDVTNPYTSGDDLLAGIGYWVGVYELDDTGKVAAFSQSSLTVDHIRQPETYSVSVSASPAGSGSVSGGGTTFIAGDTVTVVAAANSGYTFASWTEGGTVVSYSASYTFVMDASNRTLVARFDVVAPPPPTPAPVIPIKRSPGVTTGPVSGIAPTQATISGSITDMGNATVTHVRFAYRLQGASGWEYAGDASGSFVAGDRFSATLTGLQPGKIYEFQARASNEVDWGYSDIDTFLTLPANLPTVTTHGITTTGAYTVTLNGAVATKDGAGKADAITDSGFYWWPSYVDRSYRGGTPPSQAWQNSATMGPDGAFSTVMLMNTSIKETYYYVAYATNSYGTGYGTMMSFEIPLLTVTTLEPADIGLDSAILRGKAEGGTGTVKASGFRWTAGSDDVKEVAVPAGPDGAFSLKLTGLKPGTRYTYTAYASNVSTSAGESANGSPMEFTTLTLAPIVGTQTASPDDTGTGTTLNGSVRNDNGLPVTATGFVWGTTSHPDTMVSAPADGGGGFSYVIGGLQPGMTYYFAAYATNSAGTGYGNVESLVMPTEAPVVETLEASNLKGQSVTLNGYIVKNKGLPIVGSGFKWGFGPEPYNWEEVPTGGDGRTLSYDLTGLLPLSKYSFQAFAENTAGTAYGDVIEFETPPDPPEVKTLPTTYMNGTEAHVQGTVTNDKGLMVGSEYFLWGLDPDPQDKGHVGSHFDGVASARLDGLIPGGKYYYRFVAEGQGGTGYGDVLDFTMPAVVPTVTTTSASFDPMTSQGELLGSIGSNGGAPLIEYGFQYSMHSRDWKTLAIGQGLYTGDIATGISSLVQLAQVPVQGGCGRRLDQRRHYRRVVRRRAVQLRTRGPEARDEVRVPGTGLQPRGMGKQPCGDLHSRLGFDRQRSRYKHEGCRLRFRGDSRRAPDHLW